jgi:hypothetical protein
MSSTKYGKSQKFRSRGAVIASVVSSIVLAERRRSTPGARAREIGSGLASAIAV